MIDIREHGGVFGGAGLKINGKGELSATYYDGLNAGDLTVIRNYDELKTPLKMDDPFPLPTGNGNGVAFSSDKLYMVVAHDAFPFISIYKRINSPYLDFKYFKLPNPSVLPIGDALSVTFSPDDLYLIVGHKMTPFITIYKRNGDVFSKIANPSALPTGDALNVTFSPDGSLLAVNHMFYPSVSIYNHSGDIFNKIANQNIPGLDSDNLMSFSTSFTPDNQYVAGAQLTGSSLNLYKKNGNVFTEITEPSIFANTDLRDVAFSNDGVYLAVCGSQYRIYGLKILKRNGDVFTLLADPSALPEGVCWGVRFSSDDKYLIVSSDKAPYLHIYEKNGDVFTKLPNPYALPTGAALRLDCNGGMLGVAHAISPFITFYEVDLVGKYAHKYTDKSDLQHVYYSDFGVAKTTGEELATDKKIITIPL